MKKLILLIANQRSGTTAFRSALNSDKFQIKNELFNENQFEKILKNHSGKINFEKQLKNFYVFKHYKITQDRINILPKKLFDLIKEFISMNYSTTLDMSGIDIKYNQFYQIPNFLEIITKLKEDYIIKIIHLKRSNYYKIALSEIMMHKDFKDKIEIKDVNSFIKRAKRIKQLSYNISNDLKKYNLDVLDITYEELFKKKEDKDYINSQILTKIEKFLNYKFNKENTYSKLKKKLPFKFSNTVSNYKSIKSKISFFERRLIT